MEIGIYVTSNIRYLVWELHLGYQFLAAREVSCRHTLRWTPFSSVFWPLAGDVQGITCSLIVLTLAIHIFKLRAEGTILHAMKKVWGMRSELNILCWRGQGFHVDMPLHRKIALQNVDGSEEVWSNDLVLSCEDWRRLHEASYCYVSQDYLYTGIRNLKPP